MKKRDVSYLHFLCEYMDKNNRNDPPEFRKGQRLFNMLYEVRPGLADYIRATAIDPFHRDDVIRDTLVFISKNWDDFDTDLD